MQEAAYYLLIDGLNLAYRSFYAMPELARSDGFPTQALHGWVRILWKLMEIEKADRVIVFFDLGSSADRVALLPEYKAHRPDMPEGLLAQLPEIKRLCRCAGHTVVEKEGVEADDLLASAAFHFLELNEDRVGIVSADKDFAQLLSHERLIQLVPPPTAKPSLGWQRLDASAVKQKWGVSPSQIVDYLSLIGDSVDNIQGLEGVGPKTALAWLNTWGTIENILSHAGEIKPERFQSQLVEKEALLRRNQQLVRLNTSLSLDGLMAEEVFDLNALLSFCEEMQMQHTKKMLLNYYASDKTEKEMGKRELSEKVSSLMQQELF